MTQRQLGQEATIGSQCASSWRDAAGRFNVAGALL